MWKIRKEYNLPDGKLYSFLQKKDPDFSEVFTEDWAGFEPATWTNHTTDRT